MSNADQAAGPAADDEPVEASLLRSLMMAMRHQQVLEVQDALVGSHSSRQQQQQQPAPSAADEADEASVINASPPSCKPGGYSEDIFIHMSESDKDEFECRICFSIARNCHECRNAHRFCYACIYEWSSQSGQGSNLCPVCRCPGEYARSQAVNERLGRRRVRCAEAPLSRCNWRGCLSDLEGHKHRQYELHEIYTSSELPSLRPERTGDVVAPTSQRMTTTELVRRHSEAKTAAAVAAATGTAGAAAAAAAATTAGGDGRLLGRREQNSARRLRSDQQQQEPEQQQPQQQQPEPLQYKRLVRPRPPPPSATQRLQESREQLALLMTLLTIQMQERQQAMQQVQLEARRREIERRRQLAEVDNLQRRLAQVAADVSRPVQQQPQPPPQRQQQPQQRQQQQQQQATARLPSIGGARRDSSQSGGGGGGGSSGGRTGGGRP